MSEFRIPTYKVKDLVINLVPNTFLGGGSVGLCAASQASADHTPLTPHTPVILVANQIERLNTLNVFAGKLEKLDIARLNEAALDIGKAAVAGKFTRGAALCTMDMPTCDASQPGNISPFASLGNSILRVDDLAKLKIQLMDAVRAIDAVENQVEKNTLASADAILPRLEAAVEELRKNC